jgi:hypothetical protein
MRLWFQQQVLPMDCSFLFRTRQHPLLLVLLVVLLLVLRLMLLQVVQETYLVVLARLPLALDNDLSSEHLGRLYQLPVRIHLGQRVHRPWSAVLLPVLSVPQPRHHRKPDPIRHLF